MDLPDPERLLKNLLAVSLVEQREASDLLTREYQCSSLVAEWLRKNHPVIPSEARDLTSALEPQWLKSAAEYQLYLYRHERPIFTQAVAAHQALRIAGQQAAADRWVLDRIVGSLERAGLYASLLSDWLPPIRRSQDPAVRAEALNQTGKQLHHIGEYKAALDYLQQALAIFQEINDRRRRRNHTEQHCGDLPCQGRIRDGGRLLQAITRDSTGNRRCGQALCQSLQYGPSPFTERRTGGGIQGLGDGLSSGPFDGSETGPR